MNNFKRKLPNIILSLGIAMVLFFGVYQAINYPWKLMFAQWGWVELSEELPDPKPLPDSATAVMPEFLVKELAEQEGIPGQPNMLAPRPKMEVVRLGSIKIPKIQISENIVEGSGDEMFYGVGHVRGTAMPGQEGNCFLAGHRNYMSMRPFRYLDKVEVGDKIYVSDFNNTYTYEVFNIFEIEPDERWVLYPQEGESHMLTLLTCTPVLTYTQRLILQCRLVETKPLA